MNDFFRPAGEMDLVDKRDGSSYFYVPSDLDNNVYNMTDEERKEYLKNVVSGVRYDDMINETGIMIVSFDKVGEMVEDRYNIVSAEYLNSEMVKKLVNNERKVR